jgi:hypothetical protein
MPSHSSRTYGRATTPSVSDSDVFIDMMSQGPTAESVSESDVFIDMTGFNTKARPTDSD